MLIRTLALVAGLTVATFAAQAPSPAHAQSASAEAQRRANMNHDRRGREQDETPAADPAADLAAAQGLATATSSPCQVTEAVKLGDSPDGGAVYEAACATGPGYIFTASTPPQGIDCIMVDYTLAHQPAPAQPEQPARRRGRNAEPEVKYQGCQMDHNKDIQAFLRGYGTAAGLTCAIDQASVVGAAPDGTIVYEMGCPGADGARISKTATGWETTSCMQVVAAGSTCQFTTAEEQLAGFKGWIAGSDAAACDPTQFRYMGANSNGSFYEAKCSAGNGVIVRFNPQMAVQQVYACEVAQRIGGGCTMTQVPPAPAAAAPPAQR